MPLSFVQQRSLFMIGRRTGLALWVAVIVGATGATVVHVLGQTPGQTLPSAGEGQILARRLCAGCHAMENSSAAVPAGIPSLRAIANLPGQTGARLIGLLLQPHAPMPDMRLSMPEIQDLLAYLESLRTGTGEPLIDLSPGKDLPPTRRG
jgi:cytochrome c553